MQNLEPEFNELVIDERLAKRLVDSQFSHWSGLPVEPVATCGWDNRTFRLGHDMSIRLPSAQRYAAQVNKEQFWLPRLAPWLPLPIPSPIVQGEPGCGYPWHWSIYRWLEGDSATSDSVDLGELAVSLGRFLVALQRIESAEGPAAGAHNFFRGGALSVYDSETRQALAALQGDVPPVAAKIWELALSSQWKRRPVWIHGDVNASNLLVKQRELTAVIDFGTCGVGDPACDLAIAWNLFSGESRALFRDTLKVDKATWDRGRGWALWKALITQVQAHNQQDLQKSQQVIEELVADYCSGPNQ